VIITRSPVTLIASHTCFTVSLGVTPTRSTAEISIRLPYCSRQRSRYRQARAVAARDLPVPGEMATALAVAGAEVAGEPAICPCLAVKTRIGSPHP
jgi:hypothetical protein